MPRSELLDFIFKVKVSTDKGEEYNLGTAFIISEKYAITAQHVINGLDGQKLILESFDGTHRILECNRECGLLVKEKNIDIAIIKYNYSSAFYEQIYCLCNDETIINDEYRTYGFPKLNNNKEFYISGEVISPEGRLSIVDSSGEYRGIALYKGVSGAPLIIGNIIKGIITDELLTSSIHKPELCVCQFSNVMEYLRSSELVGDKEKMYSFLQEHCKKNTCNIHKLDPFYEMYDDEYANIKDKRNLREKILKKCPEFPTQIIDSWDKRCVRARLDLKKSTSNQKKAVLMVVFAACIEYIEEELINIDISHVEQLRKCINELKSRTIRTVTERLKDFDYGINNMITFENTIFNLIDSCFLSFDSYLEEGQDVLE